MSDTRDPETAQTQYGTGGLQPFNGRDPLLGLEQGLRDALVYARQVRWERDNPPVTDGLMELRDALVLEFAEALCASTPPCIHCLNDIEKSLESGPLSKAVATLRREAFERGASPAVGVLLAEIQDSGPGNYRAGLERAVTLLTEANAMKYSDAYERGWKQGFKDGASTAEVSTDVNQKPAPE